MGATIRHWEERAAVVCVDQDGSDVEDKPILPEKYNGAGCMYT